MYKSESGFRMGDDLRRKDAQELLLYRQKRVYWDVRNGAKPDLFAPEALRQVTRIKRCWAIIMTSDILCGSTSCLRIAWPVNSHLACRTTLFLSFDFSSFNVDETYEEIRQSFRLRCNATLSLLRSQYTPLLDNMPEITIGASVSDNLAYLLYYLQVLGSAPLYVIIDGYDNFAHKAQGTRISFTTSWPLMAVFSKHSSKR